MESINIEKQVTLEMIKDARKAMEHVIQRTPLVTSNRLSPNLFFKAENTQRTGSFKLRGAYNRIRLLNEEEKKHGVIACSAGNHAQGIALAATKQGIRSIVCMPDGAPIMKKEATMNYGAEVVLISGGYDNAAKDAERLSKENNYTFIHPFDDPYVIAGQGTIGLEILEEYPEVEQVLVPVGGGGLISGIAIAIKSLKPECKVIGVEPSKVASMSKSLEANRIVTIPNDISIADGLHVLTPGKLTFQIIKKYVDKVVTVDEMMISAAVTALLVCPKLVAEGAGATATAAFMYGDIDRSKKTVSIVSGGNVDLLELEKNIKDGYDLFEKYVNGAFNK